MIPHVVSRAFAMYRTRRTAVASASIAIACVLSSPSVRAQSSSPPPSASPDENASSPPPPATETAFPVGHVIEVRIDPPLPGEDPWTLVGLHRGDNLDRLTARGALRAALASGTFAEARASVVRIPGGLQLLIEGERREARERQPKRKGRGQGLRRLVLALAAILAIVAVILILTSSGGGNKGPVNSGDVHGQINGLKQLIEDNEK